MNKDELRKLAKSLVTWRMNILITDKQFEEGVMIALESVNQDREEKVDTCQPRKVDNASI